METVTGALQDAPTCGAILARTLARPLHAPHETSKAALARGLGVGFRVTAMVHSMFLWALVCQLHVRL